MCRHYVACCRIDKEPEAVHHALAFEDFYYRLGVALLGTVMDGDCGLDVCCQMLGILQNVTNRNSLRKDNQMLQLVKYFVFKFVSN